MLYFQTLLAEMDEFLSKQQESGESEEEEEEEQRGGSVADDNKKIDVIETVLRDCPRQHIQVSSRSAVCD